MTDNVLRLESAANACSSCHEHHSPDVITRIGLIQTDIKQYEDALSNYMTASADKARITRLKLDAAEIGNRLLARTEKMSVEAAEKLAATTSAAMSKIAAGPDHSVSHHRWLTFLAGVAHRRQPDPLHHPPDRCACHRNACTGAAATWGTRSPIQDRTEFGELAGHFNTMSSALRTGTRSSKRKSPNASRPSRRWLNPKAFLNTIFDSIRDPFCIIDRSYHIVRANEAYAEHEGRIPLADLIGADMPRRALTAGKQICGDCIVQATFLSGNASAKEKAVDRQEGIYDLVRDLYLPDRRTSEGTISHVVEYTRDITERKRAEVGAPRKRRTVRPGRPRRERRAVGLGPEEQHASTIPTAGSRCWATGTRN